MATALDLLMSAKEDVNLLSEQSDICTIDAKTRIIFVPSTIVVGGVQSDKNAERIKFSCPKIVGDNLDLSKFSVRINFENVSSVDFNVSIKDQYICDDVAVDGENVTFSWLIGRNAARYMGTVRFIVCAVKTDSDSNISVEWNTTIAEVPVLEGIEIDQPQIGQEEKDVINQLLELTKNTSAEAVQNVNSAKEQAIKDIQSVSQPDTTLTIEGGLAEAKATGEAIGSIKEDLDKSKENISQLFEASETLEDAAFNTEMYPLELSAWETEGWYSSKGVKYTTSGYVNSKNEIEPNKTYKIHYFSYYETTYAILDENDNILSVGESADSVGEASHSKWIDETIITPSNAKYIALSSGDSGTEILNRNETSLILRVVNNMQFYPIDFNYEASKMLSPSWTIIDSGTIEFFFAKVPVENQKHVRLTSTTNWGNPHYGFKDKNGNIISIKSASSGIQTLTNEIIDIPSNAVELIINQYAKYPIRIETLQKITDKKWKGKKWVVIGDSLTDLNGRAYKHYFDYISWKTGIEIVYMGVSDTGYAKGISNNNAFYQRIENIDTSADVITIFGSFNDLASGLSIGNITDNTNETIAGCVNLCINEIYSKIPLANLGIVTPCPWEQYTPMDSDDSASVKYVDVLIDISKKRGIPCLDLFRESGIRPWESTVRSAIYKNDNGSGTHPDSDGQRILYPKFESLLEKLIY